MEDLVGDNDHLLQDPWVLWYRPPVNSNSAPQAKNWENSQKKKFLARSVEEFWKGFQEIPRITPSHPINCDYSLFKEGIKPMWEDEFNKNGGRWTYTLERRGNTNMSGLIEEVWLEIMLCLIGEGFHPYGDQIAGGVCGIRPNRGMKGSDGMGAKIHIWTKDAANQEANIKIGEVLKKVLRAGENSLTYAPHESSGGKRGQGNLRL